MLPFFLGIVGKADMSVSVSVQLREQMRQGNVFVEFSEGPIRFAPTYKYDPMSTQYDTGEKRRAPAWCDRVLWKGRHIRLRSYQRHELLSSDHRPVSALFDVQVKCRNEEKQRQVYTDIVRQLDRLENECQPDAIVSAQSLCFANVRYNTPQSLTAVLENTGMVVARWRFIAKGDEPFICKRWLYINPPFGMILPKAHQVFFLGRLAGDAGR
jgi:inositol polyphosphate 5-phosphatase INPP5B/F